MNTFRFQSRLVYHVNVYSVISVSALCCARYSAGSVSHLTSDYCCIPLQVHRVWYLLLCTSYVLRMSFGGTPGVFQRNFNCYHLPGVHTAAVPTCDTFVSILPLVQQYAQQSTLHACFTNVQVSIASSTESCFILMYRGGTAIYDVLRRDTFYLSLVLTHAQTGFQFQVYGGTTIVRVLKDNDVQVLYLCCSHTRQGILLLWSERAPQLFAALVGCDVATWHEDNTLPLYYNTAQPTWHLLL